MNLTSKDIQKLSPAAQRQIRKAQGGRESRTKPETQRKFGNTPCDYTMPDGTVMHFDSKKECSRFADLMLMQRCGEISDLRCQVEYLLIPAMKRDDGSTERACKYIADFVYRQDGKEIVEDAKGYRDPKSAGYAKFVIKRKLMLQVHGITVREV